MALQQFDDSLSHPVHSVGISYESEGMHSTRYAKPQTSSKLGFPRILAETQSPEAQI